MPLNLKESSRSCMQSHEIQKEKETSKDSPTGEMKRSETQSMILYSDSDSVVEEDTEAKAAINDKQVRKSYYCGNWQAYNEQAPHNTDT